MARLILFVVLAFLAWLAVRMLGGGRRRDADAGRGETSTARGVEAVAQCAWCGVHVPAATAAALPDGRIYCGEAHREQARLAGASPDRPAS